MACIELEYPFDPFVVLRKKKSIKKGLLQQTGLIDKKIAILGGSTTHEIKEILELFLLYSGIMPEFYESDFNRYYEEAVFDNRQLKEFNPDIIYIHTTSLNITRYPGMKDSASHIDSMAAGELGRYIGMWQAIRKDYGCVIIQNNFELPSFRALGNLDFSDARGRVNYIMRLNREFAEFAGKTSNFYINDINYLSSWLGLSRWYDRRLWHLAKYALSYEAIPYLAHNIAALIKSLLGKSRKCLVLDLDDTLWGGVVGDDGVEGLQIGRETALGEAYVEFQEYVRILRGKGIILAVCSKNELESAHEGFSHPGNVLHPDDFAAFKVNWNPKHENIKDIASELNIGRESLVFIDDNRVERELVKSQLPEVAVTATDEGVSAYIDVIDKAGYFETVSLSDEDLRRSQLYVENAKRTALQQKFSNYEDFLRSLEMEALIKKFDLISLDRITQLLNKTNQFNLTGRRYNHSEVVSIADNTDYVALYGKLTDRFGDNGIVSVIIGVIKDRQVEIEAWIMSCRVFKREMEFAMFDEFIRECDRRGMESIRGSYRKTAKNNIVKDLYQTLGFVPEGPGSPKIEDLRGGSCEDNGDAVWSLRLPEQYCNKSTTIRIVHG